MDAIQFKQMFRELHNMDRWTLEEAGLIPANASGDSKWKRFNNNLTTFVLKLSPEDAGKLMRLALCQTEDA